MKTYSGKFIRMRISPTKTRDTDRQFLADAINEVVSMTGLELPDEFMKRWLMENNQGKISKEQLDEQYDSYAKTFRWQLIESKLHEQFGEDIQVKEEEVSEFITICWMKNSSIYSKIMSQFRKKK